ncbi:hypothetical protein DFH11DRAFT_1727816 [Phellopilus nigrolimitatus]|nr:hypothetical protein DFH11DRAFT_1727816 [Phellopilus nigrolimitatus]
MIPSNTPARVPANLAQYHRQQTQVEASIRKRSHLASASQVAQPQPTASRSQIPVPHDPVLKQQVVALLSSTANGCIAELGYAKMCEALKTGEATRMKLLAAYEELKAISGRMHGDNMKLTEILNEKEERERVVAQQTEALKSRINQLEKEQDLMKRQYAALQQTQTMNATDAYKVLEQKYTYVLEVLKKHHAPIIIQNKDSQLQAHTINPQVAYKHPVTASTPIATAPHEVNNQPPAVHSHIHGDILSPATEFLTQANSPSNFGISPPAQGSTPSAMQQDNGQIMPKLSGIVPSTSNAGTPIAMLMASPPTPMSSLSQTSPITSSSTPRLNSVSGCSFPPTTLASEKGPVDTGTVTSGPGSTQTQTPQLSPVAERKALGISEFSRSIIRALQEKPGARSQVQSPPKMRPQSSSRTHTKYSAAGSSDRVAVQTQSKDQITSQPQPHSPHLTAELPPIVAKQTSTTFATQRQSKTQSTQLSVPSPPAVTQAQADPQFPPQVPAPTPSVPNTAEAHQELRTSSHPSTPVPLTPTTAQTHPESATAPLSPTPAPSTAASEAEIEAQVPPQSPTPEPPSVPSVPSAPVTEAMDIDAANAVSEFPHHQNADIVMDKEVEAAGDEDEEEEEDWADLTDDEGAEKRRTVVQCLSCSFFDDSDDERFCSLCDKRIESLKLPDPRPTFSECTMRELIIHMKNEHPGVWEGLRKGA